MTLLPGDVLRAPDPDARATSAAGHFMDWVQEHREVHLADWEALRRWSIEDLEGFWGAVWKYFEIIEHAPYERVLAQRELPGGGWFPGALLNYAEHAFGRPEDVDQLAVLAHSQARDTRELTFGELHEQVRRARAGLQRLGVGRGDVVVGYLPNIPETLVAFLATASLSAIWAACAPEFGVSSRRHGRVHGTRAGRPDAARVGRGDVRGLPRGRCPGFRPGRERRRRRAR